MSQSNSAERLGLTEKTLEKLCSVFQKHSGILQAIIYGSRAKGNFRNGSDIDLAIKGQAISFSELMQIENEIDDLLLPYTVDLSDYKQLKNQELVEHIDRVGVVIYTK